MAKKVRTKIWISQERKELLRLSKKLYSSLFIIFDGLLLKQVKQTCLEGERGEKKNEPQKLKNLLKMLRKSLVSNACAAIFNNNNFS